MINLIPQFAKKKITHEYWLRVVTAWFFLWGLSLLIAITLLFPAYIFTTTQLNVNAESARSAEESVADFENLSKELEKASLQAQYVIENSRLTRAHQYINLFESLEGDSISVAEVNFVKDTKGVQPISLKGTAVDRESLAAFRDRLLAEEAVSQVDLPISNLAKDKDIDFSITVTMNNKVEL